METRFAAKDLRALGEDGPYNVSNALLEYVAQDDSYRVITSYSIHYTKLYETGQYK